MTAPRIAIRDKVLLDRARAAIEELEPAAQVILFGSRARGDAGPDSDWDLLVLVDGVVDSQRADAISQHLLELQSETGACLSAIVHSREEWGSPLSRAMPLHENIDRDGLALGESIRHLPRTRWNRRSKAMEQAREEIVRYRMNEGQEALAAAELTFAAGLLNRCVSSLYYSCFYAASALLLRRGLSSHRHTSAQELFNREFGRSDQFPRELMKLCNVLAERRLKGDYEDFFRFDEHEVRPWVAQVRQFVEQIERLLAAPAEGE